MDVELGPVGVWSTQLLGDDGVAAAVELEALGYPTAWMPGGVGNDVFAPARAILEATERLVLAIGVLPIYLHDPTAVAAAATALQRDFPDRFLLGLGVSHAPLVEAAAGGRRWERPLATMAAFLDALDAAGGPPPEERVLGALGPKMLGLAAARSAGAHPYLVTTDHTRFAREVLGPDPLLAPEQGVILETDAATARARARQMLGIYLGLPNYTNNLRRFGFGDEDVAEGGSDRLVDALFPWGDEARLAQVVAAHHAAGADHVCLQVLGPDPRRAPLDEWRRLAGVLLTA